MVKTEQNQHGAVTYLELYGGEGMVYRVVGRWLSAQRTAYDVEAVHVSGLFGDRLLDFSGELAPAAALAEYLRSMGVRPGEVYRYADCFVRTKKRSQH
jgi:hypothetical protein